MMPQYYKKKQGLYVYWSDTDFDVGDIVKKRAGSGAETLGRNDEYKITRIEYSSSSEYQTLEGTYENIYRQRLYVEKITYIDQWTDQPSSSGYLAKNFHLYKKGAPPVSAALVDHLTPTVAIEIDVDAQGNDVIKAGAEYVEYESMSKARAAVSKIISESIRERNEYRRFRVFSNSVVAGAKEPEIEFK